jgi:hypothetical protein
MDQRKWNLIGVQHVGALGPGSSTWLIRERERERDNSGVMLMSGEGKRRSIRIESVMDEDVGGQHTLSGAACRRGGGEIGQFWVRREMVKEVPLL